MEKAYIGYCRISTDKQNIERQKRNIISAYPTAELFAEAKTGTTFNGRTEWEKAEKRIYDLISKGIDVTLIVDSISRLSRNAEAGLKVYFELYDKGVHIISLKEPQCNSDIYKTSTKDIKVDIETGDADADETFNIIAKAISDYSKKLAKRQIIECFKQSQKEVDDMRQRTKEGIETARKNGKAIGGAAVKHRAHPAENAIKTAIRTQHKLFEGNCNDEQVMGYIRQHYHRGCGRGTYYKYKKELLAERENQQCINS